MQNWGVSGDKPENLLWRLEQVRGQHRWATVILIVGVNAAVRSPGCATVAASIEADVSAIRRISPRSQVLVVGVMPYMPGLRASLPQIAPINAALRANADRLAFRYVDAGQALMRTCLDRDRCPLLIDWLHPSVAGYVAIWQAVRGALASTSQIPHRQAN